MTFLVLGVLNDGYARTYTTLASELDIPIESVRKRVRRAATEGWVAVDRMGRMMIVEITDEGREALHEYASRPTVNAVIAEARKLCDRAAREIAADPYAKPYAPSDRAAYVACQRYGPERAIQVLQERASRARIEQREANEISERAALRHERRQRQMERDRQAWLAGLSPGQRLDRALANLSILSTAATSRLDTDVVHDGGGGKDNANPVPYLHDNSADVMHSKAMRIIREIEDRVEFTRRRPCSFERSA